MSKGLGQKIVIKFTQDLIGDISHEYQKTKKITGISASASSQFDNTYAPWRAVDGNTSTRWASANKSGTQYIQFNLGALYNVGIISAMCGSGYVPEVFNVLISEDGNDFITISVGNTIDKADTLVEFDLGGVTCKFIRLVFTSTKNTNFYELKEFEAYTHGSDGPTEFTVTGKEYKYVNGPLIDASYKIDKMERYPDTEDTILLTTISTNRFNNAVGEITVSYDKGKGNLQGIAGAVESFKFSFLPTDLIPKPNPMVTDRFIVSPTINIDFIKIIYNSRYGSINLIATADCAIDFIPVEDINP